MQSDFDDLITSNRPSFATFPADDGGFGASDGGAGLGGGGFGDDDFANPFAEMQSSAFVSPHLGSPTGYEDESHYADPEPEPQPEPEPEPELDLEDDYDAGVSAYQPTFTPASFDIPHKEVVEEDDGTGGFGEPMKLPSPDISKSFFPVNQSRGSSPETERGFGEDVLPPAVTYVSQAQAAPVPPPEPSPVQPPSAASSSGFKSYPALSPDPPPRLEPVFRPFGVTATLTSSEPTPPPSPTEDPFANRPQLPDILGGGAEAMAQEARGGVPAFKKRIEKEKPKSIASAPKRTGSSEPIKPYRPVGFKRAEPKPVLPRAPPAPTPAPAPAPKPPVLAPISTAPPAPPAVAEAPKHKVSPRPSISSITSRGTTSSTVGIAPSTISSPAPASPVRPTATLPTFAGADATPKPKTTAVPTSPTSSLAKAASVPLPTTSPVLSPGPSTPTQPGAPALPRSASDSEDERPLASVRQSLVAAQSAANSPGLPSLPGPGSVAQVQVQQVPVQVEKAPPRYVVGVGDPQKMGGLNDIHTVYTVKTRATDPEAGGPLKGNTTVLRRFRDFAWLGEVLAFNNPGVIVPPIPDKNLRIRLYRCEESSTGDLLMKCCSHPMLVSDPDLKLFLESDTFSLEIKHRKPDPSSSQQGWLSNLSAPRFSETDDFYISRRAQLDTLETQLKSLHGSLAAAAKTRSTVSASLVPLAQALAGLATCDLSKPLRHALERLSSLQHRLKSLNDEQAKSEEEGLVAVIEAYGRGVGSGNLEKARRQGAAGLAWQSVLAEVTDAERKAHASRNDYEDVSKLIKAEMQRFDHEKVEDFKAAVLGYVEGMLGRQQLVVQAWQGYHQLLQEIARGNNGVLAPPAPDPSEQARESEATATEAAVEAEEEEERPEEVPVTNGNGPHASNGVGTSEVETTPWS